MWFWGFLFGLFDAANDKKNDSNNFNSCDETKKKVIMDLIILKRKI